MKGNALIFAILLALVSCFCFADSETRPATQQEKQFYLRATEACISAVSSISNTWEKIDESGHEPQEFELVVPGCENSPLVHHYYVEWADQPRLDQANSEIATVLDKIAPAIQDNGDIEYIKQLEDLEKQVTAATTAGNMAEVARLNARAEEITAQNEKIFSEVDREFREAVEKLAARDARAVVRIGINQFYQGFDAEPVNGKLADGTSFYRVENGRMYNDSWTEGTTFILLGTDWKSQRDEAGFSMEKQEDKSKPYTSVQTVVIAVEAEQKRAETMLNSMKLESLQELFEK